MRSALAPVSLKEACVRVRIARRRALAWCGLGYFFVSFDEVGGEVVRRDTGGLTITPNPRRGVTPHGVGNWQKKTPPTPGIYRGAGGVICC